MGTDFRRLSVLIMQRFLYPLIRSALAVGWLFLSASQVAVASQAAERNILVLGDSISAAYGMSLEQGWVALLEERLAREDTGFSVVNASISGETSDGGLRRLPALLEEHNPELVIIELGANDGLRGFPLGRLRNNLAAMSRASKEAGASVVLVAMEIPPNYGARYTSGFRESFSTVARDTGAVLTPFILEQFAFTPPRQRRP
jgi:acyl-CoA thioesterase-1